jgi:hypothetical protein
MGYLYALIEAWQDANGRPSVASLARRMEVSDKVISAWKTRGVKQLPEPETLRALGVAIGQPYEVVLAAAEADAGYRTDPELEAAMRGRGLPADVRDRLRAHVGEPALAEPVARRRRKAQ